MTEKRYVGVIVTPEGKDAYVTTNKSYKPDYVKRNLNNLTNIEFTALRRNDEYVEDSDAWLKSRGVPQYLRYNCSVLGKSPLDGHVFSEFVTKAEQSA